MNANEDLNNFDANDLLCALDNNHYVLKPFSLTCGHVACHDCINIYKEANGTDKIKCELCNKEYLIDFDVVRESKLFQNYLSLNLTNLLKIISIKFESELCDLKMKMSENRRDVVSHTEFIKGEIDLKVESLKAQLDEMRMNMVKKLDDIKYEFDKNQSTMKYWHYSDKLYQLKEKLKKDTKLDEETYVDISNSRKMIQQNIQSIQSVPLKVFFESGNDIIEESIIGKIEYNFKNIMEDHDNKEVNKINLDYTPKGLCCISDNRLLVSDVTNKCLKLYDENFKLMKKIDKINNKHLTPYAFTTDGYNRIYVSNYILNSIVSLNLSLDFIIEIGSKGNQSSQFDGPLGLDLSGDSVYVCDCNNKRIQKFNKVLEFEKIYPLQFKPWMIKVINNYALIRPNGEPNILSIYSLEPKMKIINKMDGNSTIHKYESGFYAFSYDNRQLKCFDSKGGLVSEIKTVFPKEVDISDGNLSLEFLNGSLVISCSTANTLVVIK